MAAVRLDTASRKEESIMSTSEIWGRMSQQLDRVSQQLDEQLNTVRQNFGRRIDDGIQTGRSWMGKLHDQFEEMSSRTRSRMERLRPPFANGPSQGPSAGSGAGSSATPQRTNDSAGPRVA